MDCILDKTEMEQLSAILVKLMKADIVRWKGGEAGDAVAHLELTKIEDDDYFANSAIRIYPGTEENEQYEPDGVPYIDLQGQTVKPLLDAALAVELDHPGPNRKTKSATKRVTGVPIEKPN